MAQLKTDLQILQTAYNLLPENIEIEQTTTYRASSSELTTSRTLSSANRVSIGQIDQFNQFKKKVAEEIEKSENKQALEKEFKELFAKLQPQYQVGDVLQEVTGLQALNFGEEFSVDEDQTFAPKEGVVTLVDFWATWCGPCQRPMAHNQEMLEKHEDWSNKVEIVGLSVDDEVDDVKQRVTTKKWLKVKHYKFKNGWDGENFALKAFSLRGIPFVALVDQNKKIIYKGHPSHGNLEEKIQKLLQGGEEAQPAQDKVEQQQAEPPLFDKDVFKQMKARFKGELHEAVKQLGIENLEVTLSRTNKIGRDGSRVGLQRSPLQLSYLIELADKEKLLAFIEKSWNTQPEDQRKLGKTKINDPEGTIREIREQVTNFAKEEDITLDFTKELQFKLQFEKNGELKAARHEADKVAARNVTTEKLKNFKQKVTEYIKPFEVNDQEFECEQASSYIEVVQEAIQYKAGSQFAAIADQAKLGSQEFGAIEHKPGQVLVIDYWAFWCGPCIGGLKKNSKILSEKKAQWGDAVRVVALSLETEGPEAKECLSKNPEFQEHIEFYFPKVKSQVDTELFGIRYIPFYVVVDQKGIIRKLGSIDSLADVVDGLLKPAEDQQGQDEAQAQAPVQGEAEGAQQIAADTLTKLEDLQKAENVKNLLNGIPAHAFQFKFEIHITKNADGTFGNLKKSSINYWVRDKNQPVLEQLLNVIYALVPKDKIQIDGDVGKTHDIPFPGQECVLCKKELNDQTPQYYSPFKNEFVCCECAEFDDQTQKGLKRYKYTDALVFINAPLTDLSVLRDIDDHKFGKNAKIGEDEEGSQKHQMMCNGCPTNAPGPRYISVTARPGPPRGGGYCDYCSQCFAKLKNRDSEAAQEIVKKDAKDGMQRDSLFLRVLFSLGYYDF